LPAQQSDLLRTLWTRGARDLSWIDRRQHRRCRHRPLCRRARRRAGRV